MLLGRQVLDSRRQRVACKVDGHVWNALGFPKGGAMAGRPRRAMRPLVFGELLRTRSQGGWIPSYDVP